MEYSDFVKTTDIKAGQHDIEFYFDGMREENGEISGILKRVRRGDYGEGAQLMLRQEGMLATIQSYTNILLDLIKEIGDEHWYQTRALQEIGIDWDTIEKANMEKLAKRVEKGTIVGKGDDR